MAPQPFAVYRLYDKVGLLLYVGCTINLGSRLFQHGRKPRFAQVTYISLIWYTMQKEARAAERRAIEHEKPQWNIQDAGTHTVCPRCGGPKTTPNPRHPQRLSCVPCKNEYTRKYYREVVVPRKALRDAPSRATLAPSME